MNAPRPLPRDDLRELEGYHSPQLHVSVRLNTNESPYAPPPAFMESWLSALAAEPLQRYPDRGATALRSAIASAVGGRGPECVFVANGSNEVLQTILLTYGGPRRCAVVFEPTYALHSHIARITSTELVTGERRDDFAIDPDVATSVIAARRPAVVFLCSPNNPTGTVESRSTIATIADAVEAVGGVLVVDEAYGEFADESALELVAEHRSLVVVRTYSKIWSLAGIRLGFAVGPQWLIGELDKVVLPYHLSTPTQLAGRIALDYRFEMLERVAAVVEERGRLEHALRALSEIDVFPSGANFILFRHHGDADALWQRLVDAGVLVRNFARWPRVEGCLRVTVGTPAENDAFLAALHQALRQPGAAS
jgi:histidinol-phosphate aminotransferase